VSKTDVVSLVTLDGIGNRAVRIGLGGVAKRGGVTCSPLYPLIWVSSVQVLVFF